jgi:hypothetical protein
MNLLPRLHPRKQRFLESTNKVQEEKREPPSYVVGAYPAAKQGVVH